MAEGAGVGTRSAEGTPPTERTRGEDAGRGAERGSGSGGTRLVIVADRVSESGLRPLVDDSRFRVESGAEWDRERLLSEIARAEALVVRSATTVDRTLLEAAPRLRVIGRAGVGVDNIDLEAATEWGVAVLNAPAGNTVSAAELTFALILCVVRRVAAADRSVRAGEWRRSALGGTELRGKVLGLVGAGRIGGEVARRARAFGMEVRAYDPYLTSERAEELGVARVELDELLPAADVLSLHVPLTPATRGMIGTDELARMKEGSFLVNAARGGVVDEAALARALGEGRLAGAALDVYEEEPLAEGSPLREAPNLVLTPHLGASTTEAQELVAAEIAQAVRDALLHGDLSRAVNAPAIGGDALRRLRPLLELGRRIGRVATALAPGGIREVDIRYAGGGEEAPRPLGAAVLEGVLAAVVGADQINYVNAFHLAEARGIRVETAHLDCRLDYPEFVEVAVVAEGGRVDVAAALLGQQHHPRIVRIDDYEVSVAPRGTLIVLRNRDVPGVIGKVGSLLGSHHLNIAEYYQSRMTKGGEAMAVVTVDGTVEREVLDALRGIDEVITARVVELEE